MERELGARICDLANDIASIRDRLKPITEGLIMKGRNINRYAIRPEYRKTTLKDARNIAEFVIKRLNECANKLDEYATEYWAGNTTSKGD